MKHLFAAAALGAALANAQSAPLLTVLRDNGFTQWADLIQAQDPRLLSVPGPDLVVYSPTNAALVSNGANVAVVPRQNSAEVNASYYYARELGKAGKPLQPPLFPSANGSTPNRLRVRDLGCTPGAVYETLLNNPAFVQLGAGHNQTVVEKHVSSAARPLVFTGRGASVKVTAADIPFDRGVIRPISGLFTLPRPLSGTLPILGADRFLAALERAGILSSIEGTESITVFAPTDAALKNAGTLSAAQLRQHVVVGFSPAYTPIMARGQMYRTLAGGLVTVSVQDGIVSINGAQIMASDAIIKNGVVHTIDKLLSSPTTVTPAPSTVPVSAAFVAKPLSWQPLTLTGAAVAVAAAAAAYGLA
ncbi:hypothetical protein RB595_003493 [Gaeumannomyces hyphopodioides]